MKLTTTSSLEHRIRTSQPAVTSVFGGADANVNAPLRSLRRSSTRTTSPRCCRSSRQARAGRR